MKKFILAIVIALSWQQSAMAGFAEGATAYNNKNYAVALKEITPLAKAGNADAQHLLGLMYYMGRGVARDYKQALQWHRKAALQGKADAQYVVGAMYYTGNAVPQDQKLAVHVVPQGGRAEPPRRPACAGPDVPLPRGGHAAG
jgi:TPR repeat protein